MKKRQWYSTLLVGIALLLATLAMACEPTQKTTSTTEISEEKQWEMLNFWLGTLHDLPPIYSVEELEEVAVVLFDFWFDQGDEAVKKLEEHQIPWDRTRPFCYLYFWYIQATHDLMNSSTPLDLLSSDMLVTELCKYLHDTADHLVQMKLSGEALNIYQTEDACMEGFIRRQRK